VPTVRFGPIGMEQAWNRAGARGGEGSTLSGVKKGSRGEKSGLRGETRVLTPERFQDSAASAEQSLGNPEAAARLIGAAEKEDAVLYGHAIAGTTGTITTLSPGDQAVYTDSVVETRAALGDRTFQRLRDEGRRMTTDEMLRVVAASTDGYDKADELRSLLIGNGGSSPETGT
jgi:hypothetical protein